MYFPRLVIPIATVLSGIVDFALAFAVLLVMMLYYRIMPTANVVWLPLFLLLALTTALGVGLWLSALNVQYRDVRQIVGYITQFWMYATPIVWSSTMLPGIWRTLYGINPMAGVVEGFRWALLGGYRAAGAEGAKQAMHAPDAMVWVSACVSLVIDRSALGDDPLLGSNIRRWQFLMMSPDAMGEPQPASSASGVRLHKDARNIASYLKSLYEADRVAFDDLVEALRFVVPYAQSLDTRQTGDLIRALRTPSTATSGFARVRPRRPSVSRRLTYRTSVRASR